MNEPKVLRYGITPTYRCNLSCALCNRWLDLFKWPDSDVTVDEVRRAGEMVKALPNTRLNKVRITGGEPTLHPQLVEICQVVADVWQPERRTVVLTNGVVKDRPPRLPSARWKGGNDKVTGPRKDPSTYHRPWSISPADLGLSGPCGTEGSRTQLRRLWPGLSG